MLHFGAQYPKLSLEGVAGFESQSGLFRPVPAAGYRMSRNRSGKLTGESELVERYYPGGGSVQFWEPQGKWSRRLISAFNQWRASQCSIPVGGCTHFGLSADGSRPPAASANWSLLDQSGQRSILGRDGLSANDRGCVKTVLHVVLAQD